MGDPFAVQVLESTGNLLDKSSDILLRYCASTFYERGQISARAVLHYQVDVVLVPLEILELHNVVVLDLFKYFYFLEQIFR